MGNSSKSFKLNKDEKNLTVIFIKSEHQRFINFKEKFNKEFIKIEITEEAKSEFINKYFNSNKNQIICIIDYNEALDIISNLQKNGNIKYFILYQTETEFNNINNLEIIHNNMKFIEYCSENILKEFFKKEIDYDRIPDHYISEISNRVVILIVYYILKLIKYNFRYL